jgi:hypothetical protein
MNRTTAILFATMLLSAGIVSYSDAAIVRAGGGGGGVGVSSGRSGMRTSVMIHMQQRSVPRSTGWSVPSAIVRDNAQIRYPATYGHGGRITQQAVSAPPSQHTRIVRNPGVMSNIQASQRTEIVPNHYYWHNSGGVRYCHYYNGGIHWYGFYNGPSFYWTRYYGGYWWWFDPGFDRWVYWNDGTWCWPGPDGVVYDYVDNDYYPADDAGNVTVKTPEVLPPPKEIPSASSEGASSKSPDGKRMVQIYGDRSEAFLYDTSSKQPVYLKYLGKNVDKVRYSGGKDGKPMRILVEFKDGSFALTSENGDPLDQEPAKE